MCDYTGYEFGAGYPDSVCIDGMLWDADSGDYEEGLTVGGDRFCPKCETKRYLESALDDAKDGGCGLSMWTPHVAMETWECQIAHARRINPTDAEKFLRTVKPFKTDDWPDREAVHNAPHLWDKTVEKEWRYTAS